MTVDLVKLSNSRWILPYTKIRLVPTEITFITRWYRPNIHYFERFYLP